MALSVDHVSDTHRHMPQPARLEMPRQDLRRNHFGRGAFGGLRLNLWRLAVFVPAMLATGAVIWGLSTVFAQQGTSALEYVLLALIALMFVWVTLAVSTVAVGLLTRAQARRPAEAGAIRTAMLMPIYNEDASAVFGNALAMLNDLARRGGRHSYDLFVLSDTRDDAIAAQELRAFEELRQAAPDTISVFYRRRETNTDKKVGNLEDWITGWGAGYEAFVVLDADSLMSGRTVARLAEEMAADPQAGLIQSYPQLIGAHSLFGRVQQFSNVAYGWLLAEGLATWSRSEGNYWGHNAIIRTRAFAETAGLPHINGLWGKSLILSHDFVEAGLLRRAGWTVRFLPHLPGSFEETPGTLIDYVLRDRRWCRGNLQHLRIMCAKGLHPVSRFHLFQGAAAYLMAPAWFTLLIFWALLGRDADTNLIRYFNEANPLFPNWPPEMTHIDSAVFLIVMYAMLLMPKFAAAISISMSNRVVRLYGGRGVFAISFLQEIVLSVAYAPIMMVHQTGAVLRGLFARGFGWAPQRRNAEGYPLRTLVAFHWLETVIGVLLLAGLVNGLISLWLLPIMISLLLAIPLSALSALPVARLSRHLQMHSPLTLREPKIVQDARAARLQMEGVLAE